MEGDRWRVHYCQLLGETPGTTPPQHIPTHCNRCLSVFFVSVTWPHFTHLCISDGDERGLWNVSLFYLWFDYRSSPRKLNTWEPFPSWRAITSSLLDQTAAYLYTFHKRTPKVRLQYIQLNTVVFRRKYTNVFWFFSTGSIPKVIVNHATQYLAPKVRTIIYLILSLISFYMFFFYVSKKLKPMKVNTHKPSVRVCVHKVNV